MVANTPTMVPNAPKLSCCVAFSIRDICYIHDSVHNYPFYLVLEMLCQQLPLLPLLRLEMIHKLPRTDLHVIETRADDGICRRCTFGSRL